MTATNAGRASEREGESAASTARAANCFSFPGRVSGGSSVSSLEEHEACLSESDRSFDSNDEGCYANDYPDDDDDEFRDSDDGLLHEATFDDRPRGGRRTGRLYGGDAAGDDDLDDDSDDQGTCFRARPIDAALHSDLDDMDDTPLGVGAARPRRPRPPPDRSGRP